MGISIMTRVRLCRTGMIGDARRMTILPAEILSLFTVRSNRNDGRKMDIGNVLSDDFSLHDAEIVSISMDRGTSVCRIGLSRVTGQLCTVELFGVKAFRADDFVLQNVVSRVLRSTARQFSTEESDYWVTWATSFSDTDSWLKPDSKHHWLADVHDGRLELVLFEPSIGTQIAVVCDRLIIRPSVSEVARTDST
ncbi:hypothetical protein BCY88_13645 [Paraburkholderia fungorum]|uniref:Uncharacterized protein n=1 Tax=Paraburkholderia fungorum TaxID=134537 RepID=A0A3R7IHU7_9BURK|nr:hypothetical protein BCY88_13645 [Paraburkholderia fungorum]